MGCPVLAGRGIAMNKSDRYVCPHGICILLGEWTVTKRNCQVLVNPEEKNVEKGQGP